MASEDNATTSPPQPPVRLGATIDYQKFLDCVHCGLCTAACPTYLETGDENNSPRGRIYLMRAVTDGRLDLTPQVTRHLDLCLDCRSCETACPSGVQYGRLIEPFRVEMRNRERTLQGKKRGWFERWFLHWLFPSAPKMRWALWPARIMQAIGADRLVDAIGLPRLFPKSLRRMYDQLPRLKPTGPRFPQVLPAQGKRRARVGLFTGCVADAMFGQTNWATARVLAANGCEVVIPNTQVCCGAIHYHTGSEMPALEYARQNLRAFPLGELDAVIINVAGCGSMLKDYGHIVQELLPNEDHQAFDQFSSKVKDFSEFLMQLGPVSPTGKIPMRATYHDACHLLHAQRVREQPRKLLGLIPGLELLPLTESEICCGAAGSYNLTEPEMSDRLAERKLRHILDTKAELVITANAGCSLQIQASLRRAGHLIPVVHPADILDWSYRQVSPSF